MNKQGKMDYSTIKQTAREEGIKITDLCALAPNNDPFYTGRRSEIAAAEWFIGLWRKFGYSTGVHLRRVHYQLISQDPPPTRPDGSPYLNTDKDWSYLCNAGKWARYLGLIPYKSFVDRRNPNAILNADWYQWDDPTPGFEVEETFDSNDYILPQVPELDMLRELADPASYRVDGYMYLLQEVHVEVWVEKTTMNDVLEPLCRRYNVNLITGAGEMSITSVVDFLDRVRKANRPARILYVSDYDPAGLGMPISVARKIEFLLQQGDEDLDIRLHPILLTRSQVQEYKLPRTPVKQGDKRRTRWAEEHGEGQVELDAMEALHPGELHRIVEEAILQYYDRTLQSRADRKRRELTTALNEYREDVLEDAEDDLWDTEQEYRALLKDFSCTRENFTRLAEPFQAQIDEYSDRLALILERVRTVRERIENRLEWTHIDVEDFPLPTCNLPEENNDVLYTSEREYREQLSQYKHYRHGVD